VLTAAIALKISHFRVSYQKTTYRTRHSLCDTQRKKAEPIADCWEVNNEAQPLADSYLRTGNQSAFHVIRSPPCATN